MQTNLPVIDIHCHAAGIGAGGSGCFISTMLRRNWKYRIYLQAYGISQEELSEQGDGVIFERLSTTLSESERVERAVVLALDGVSDPRGELDRRITEVYIPNDFVAKAVKKHTNLLFGASVNPYRKDALEALNDVASLGAVLVKWLPPVQLIDPADRRLIPFYERMGELDLPLLSHTGTERSFTFHRDELSDPERLRLPLEIGIKVIAAHAGGNGKSRGRSNLEIFAGLCREFPNLFGDISAQTQVNTVGRLGRLLNDECVRGRLAYGTDMPLLNTPIVSTLPYMAKLGYSCVRNLAEITNPWDRDVAFKEALGVTSDILTRGSEILSLKYEPNIFATFQTN